MPALPTVNLPILTNLKTGVYKNYPELCAALNEPVLKGKQKENQLKRWNICFDYKKYKHSYIITNIKAPEDPNQLPDCLVFNSSKYASRYIGPLLINELIHSENHTINVPLSSLYNILGFTNIRYGSKTIEDINSDVVELFYNLTYESFFHIVDEVLHELEDRKIIKYNLNYSFKICSGFIDLLIEKHIIPSVNIELLITPDDLLKYHLKKLNLTNLRKEFNENIQEYVYSSLENRYHIERYSNANIFKKDFLPIIEKLIYTYINITRYQNYYMQRIKR